MDTDKKPTVDEMIEAMKDMRGVIMISVEGKKELKLLAETMLNAYESLDTSDSAPRIIEAAKLLLASIEETKDVENMEVTMTELALVTSLGVMIGRESQIPGQKTEEAVGTEKTTVMTATEGNETIH